MLVDTVSGTLTCRMAEQPVPGFSPGKEGGHREGERMTGIGYDECHGCGSGAGKR